MKELSQLNPAQTFLILKGADASLKDLLKFTLMDLLLKQVLKTIQKNHQPSKQDPLQVITYVQIGKNFKSYKPAPYENALLFPFQKSNGLKIMFRHVVKMGFENSKGRNNYQEVICTSSELNGYVKRNFLQKIFGGFSHSESGLTLQKKLREDLDYLDEYLPPLIASNQPEALEVLKAIKGNIFLLKNIDFTLLAEIDKELMREINRNEESSGSGCSSVGCAWVTYDHDWHSFGNDWSSFDSSCGSSDSGCSASGCSGCSSSGCSGCSGCGGGD